MKYLTTLIIFLITTDLAYPAPVEGIIDGTIIDQQLQEPIPYASVVLKQEGKIFKGTVSSVEGKFVLERIPAGLYRLEVQFIGYELFVRDVEITSHQDKYHIGKIFLTPEIAELDDVQLIAERSTIEQRIDRKIIHVGKDLSTMGATASDIMNHVPSVRVDQEGNLSFRGSEHVRILVDGRPTNMDPATLLKEIPSSSIKQIELITNPSAKYSPEGMSGIINIVLHRNTDIGFNGDLSGGITFGDRISENGSLNLNYRRGNLKVYTNLGFNNRKNSLDGQILNRDLNSGEYHSLLFGVESYMGKVGVDYYLDQQNTLSFYTRQSKAFEDFDGTVSIRYLENPNLNYAQEFDTEQENNSSIFNFVYRHDFKKEGHNLEVEVDYNHYTNEEDAHYTYSGYAPRETYQDYLFKERRNTVAHLDYVLPLSEQTRIELGAESRLLRTSNDYNSTNEDIVDMNYDYDRNIYAGYATFGQEVGKWSYQIGTRLEHYSVAARQKDFPTYQDNYLNLYPSAFLRYIPGEKSTLQLSYSRRVDRPSFNQVNPVRQFSTPRLTVTGNPELQPQFTNSLEMNYTRKLGRNSLTAGLFYRIISDDITQVMRQNPQDPQHIILTYSNGGRISSYGVELSGNFNPLRVWDLSPSFNLYNKTISGFLGSSRIQQEHISYRLQANNTFKISKKLKLQLFAIYDSPDKTLQFEIDESYFANLGARYSLWEDKASLSIKFNDVFNSAGQVIHTTEPFVQSGTFLPDTQSIFIGFSYRFGGGQNEVVKRKQRDDHTAGGGMF